MGLELPFASLEEWMRRYYFDVEVDIGSSGVEDFSLAELRELLSISRDELDDVVFHDSRTLGGPGIRQALADRWLGGDADRVMVTHGSTEANFLVMTTLLSEGDEVVVLDPLYQQLWAIADSLGCRLKRWRLPPEHGFRPDLSELRRLVTPRTRMVVVNFPHNPTGVTLSRREQRELLDVVSEAGAWLVWDGAFTDLVYDGEPLPEPTRLYSRALSMGTLSKAYGLPGLRVGWCFAAPEVLEKFVRVRDYTLLHLSPLVELLAQRAVEQADTLIDLRRATARTNRSAVDRWIRRNEDRVSWVPPEGGVCGFPRFEVPDVDDLCHRLGKDHGVLMVPGSCFGVPRHARLGFGGPTDRLTRGLEVLEQVIVEMI